MNKICTKSAEFTVFKTKWGYFGLAASDNALLRTCLPLPNPDDVKSLLLNGLPAAKDNKNLFKDLQSQIIAYFEGSPVNFNKIHLSLDHYSSFSRKVLSVCQDVTYGKTTTYAQLAKKADSPLAARAIGGAMAKNPMPLIIPCHRVLRTDGQLGGFSAPGGLATKQKLLNHEKQFSS